METTQRMLVLPVLLPLVPLLLLLLWVFSLNIQSQHDCDLFSTCSSQEDPAKQKSLVYYIRQWRRPCAKDNLRCARGFHDLLAHAEAFKTGQGPLTLWAPSELRTGSRTVLSSALFLRQKHLCPGKFDFLEPKEASQSVHACMHACT